MVPTAANAGVPQYTPHERPRPPPPAVEAEEAQWIFTEEELEQTPSILDGMSIAEERHLRQKGINFLQQVGMMLKLPMTTLSTAAVFFNRFLVRNSLQARPGYKPLHHYQIAATALFLATKVEEQCRKMKEIVVACVRVALKDPNKLVDEQTKDFWKWRDTILYSEDILLESLCFDLSVEAPHQIMYRMLTYYGIQHNKRVRNAAWAFLMDSLNTLLCLQFNARTIAAASVYCGARMADIKLPHVDGMPWWETQYVKLRDIRKACNIMADLYENLPPKEGEERNMYSGLRSPEEIDMSFQTPRSLANGDVPVLPASQGSVGAAAEASNGTGVANGTAEMNMDVDGGTNAANSANVANGQQNATPAGDGSEEGELSG
ncbi:cyclin-like protein [Westerdykella ornata]|uniref:RNA polymerase II holoenzyme cyclin-like subunit n=1 Tax=Westerdykella ornata TaxID=318751 RepID=A0A6A6JCJ6_WESOR|nr:cyclin-like protein [Westerdykella ornata]KAF2274152.1 cyclin-like protein [Westerdykella ornata]